MAQSPAAVVFDVDGTLVDSERDGHRVAFNRAFEHAGLSYRWDVAGYGRLLRTAGGRRRIGQFLLEQGHDPAEAAELAAKLHEVKTAVFRDMVEGGLVPLRPGVARLVQELRERRVPLHVATTGSREWVAPLLARHFGADVFEQVVTGTEVPDLKPDPAAYREVVRLTGTTPAGVVAVEDSRNGLLAAKGAGLACLVVTNDYTRDQDFSGADAVVDDFTAVTVEALGAL